MEWVLRKTPLNINQALMIDDTDKINSIVAIDVLMNFYHLCSKDMQLKVICNLLALVKGNSANHEQLLKVPTFQYWLFDILLHY